MKIMMLNGSSKERGCTYTALSVMAKVFSDEGIESEIIGLGAAPLRDCIGCNKCAQLKNRCVFNDDAINSLIEKAEESDGFVFGTPVYYAHPTGRLLSALDRMFFAGKAAFMRKPAAAVASARRAGTTASLDVINKYFTISEMPVVSSSYWNMVHGQTPEEVLRDEEGLQTLRNLARNMAWLIKCIDAGKKAGITPPAIETGARTNFIR